jgi:hypothetical protein
MKLRAFTGTVSIFAWYMQVRLLAMKLSEAKSNGSSSNNSSSNSSSHHSMSSLSDPVTPLLSSAIMLSNSTKLNSLQEEVGSFGGGENDLRAYLEAVVKDESKLDEVCDRLEGITLRERAQRELNAQLLSTIAGLKGTIQVYCRIRPHSDKERQQDRVVESGKNVSPASVSRGVQALGVTEVGVYDTYNQSWRSFPFDRVWGQETTQAELFLEIEPLALSVVDGDPCCIMAYGQTGSGKTYTMHGDGEKNLGISYRTMHKIFTLLELHRSKHAKVCVCVCEC